MLRNDFCFMTFQRRHFRQVRLAFAAAPPVIVGLQVAEVGVFVIGFRVSYRAICFIVYVCMYVCMYVCVCKLFLVLSNVMYVCVVVLLHAFFYIDAYIHRNLLIYKYAYENMNDNK